MSYQKRFIGDPGCALDDLALKPEDYRRLGIEILEERDGRMSWKHPEAKRRLNILQRDNVIDLTKVRRGKSI